MANGYINQVTLPDKTVYDIRDSISHQRGIEYIRGTWTAASGTWTGNSTDTELYDGKQIILYMPFAGSGNATLNLTLADGTVTGAKNVYYESTTRFTTHKGQNSQLHLIYHSAHTLSNGSTYEGWWYMANYNTDTTGYYHRRIYPNLKAGNGGIHPYAMIMQLPDGKWSSIVTASANNPGASNVSPKATDKVASSNAFLLGNVLLMYANATYADGVNVATYNIWSAHSGLIDARYSFNLQNVEGKRFIGYTPVYIVGSVNNGVFTLDSTQWWTQSLPISDDGKVYIYVGDAYDWYRLTFTENNPIYWYKNGSIRLYSNDASTVCGYSVSANVPTTAAFTDTWIPLSTDTAGYVSIAPNDTTKFLRGDASWATLPAATSAVAGITLVGASGGAAAYSHGTHVTSATVKAALSATASTTAKKYLKDTGSFVQVSYNDLSNVPASFAPTAHDHGHIDSSGQLGQTSGWALGNNDGIVVFDGSNANKIERSNILFDMNGTGNCLTQAGTWAAFNNYVHPTDSGNKHIPTGGSSGQFLGYQADGTAKWVNNPNTHYVTHLYVNTNSVADTTTETTTNEQTYIHLYDDSNHRDVIQLTGSQGITLSSNSTGKITISHSHTAISAKTSYVSSATAASANGGTISVTDIKYDADGHITASTDRTITLSAPVTSVATLTGAISASDLVSQLGLSSAMHYRGETTTNITTGTANTTATVIINNTSVTATNGDVVTYGAQEYVWANNKWNLLGDEGSYKVKQTAVTDPDASTSTSTTFIDTISQNANGVITPTKKTLPTASTAVAGIIKIGTAATNAMAGNTNVNNVSQGNSTTSNWRKVLLSGSDYAAQNTAVGNDVNAGTYRAVGISAQPSTGTLAATIFKIGTTNTTLSANNLTFAQGGGWSMSDSTWIRTVGSKSVYMNSGTFRCDGTVQPRYIQHINANTAQDGAWSTGATGTAGDGTNNGTTGTNILSLGNSTAVSKDEGVGNNNSRGYLRIYSNQDGYGELSGYTTSIGTHIHAASGLSIRENAVGILFRPGSSSYYTHISYQTDGNEALVSATQLAATSFIFVNGEPYNKVANNRWRSLDGSGAEGKGNAPGLQIKNNCVSIGKLIPSGTAPTYKLELNGGKTYLNYGTASSTTNLSGQLIVANEAGGNVAIELWRNANASWQIANESGNLYIRNNWTNAKQTTYTQTSISINYNTGNTTFTGTVTSAGFSGPLEGNVTGNVSGNITGNVEGDLTGTASNVTTTADTTNAMYIVGVKNGATTTLLHDTKITATGSVLKIDTLTITGGATNASMSSTGTLTIANATNALTLSTTTANLTISTTNGNFEAKSTGTGTVKLTGTTGAMTISTTNGNITVGPTGTGTLTVKTVSGAMSIQTTSGAITVSAGSSLTLNSAVSTAILFQKAGTTKWRYSADGTAIHPETTASINLGIAAGGTEANARRWGKLIVGTADSYGSYGLPVYWNAGVPASTYPVQYTTWTIASGGSSVVLTKSGKYFADTYVIALVVTSGEANLNGPITWTSAADKLTLTTSTATSGAVSGYVLTARGESI